MIKKLSTWIVPTGLSVIILLIVFNFADNRSNKIVSAIAERLEFIETNQQSLLADQQSLMAGINYETEKQIKILKIRDFIQSVNGNISPQLAFDIAEINYKMSEKYNVDLNLAVAIQAIESHFNYAAESSAGAIGIFQIMPFNLRLIYKSKNWEYNKNRFVNKKALDKQIEIGYIYLSTVLAEYENINEILIVYNAGQDNLKLWRTGNQLPQETKNYILKVTKTFKKLKG